MKTEKKQTEIPGIQKTPAGIEADRYAEIENDIDSKKDLLVQQREKVLQAMKKAGQRVLSYTDDYGFKHTFAVVDSQEKLRHSKRMEA